MKIYSDHTYEDILFAIEYLNFPIFFNPLEKGIMLEVEGKTYSGEKEVLKKFFELCKCEPHDLSMINEQIVDEILTIRKTPVKKYLTGFLMGRETDFNEDEPSNIPLDRYVNGKNMSMADLVLFARIYKNIKEGMVFNVAEINWFVCFQDEIAKKMDIRKIENLDFDLLDIRVGTIESVRDHPNADSLYIESVMAHEKIQVLSGIKKRINKEDLIGKKFLFLVNMKPIKLRGEKSYGMILCASHNDQFEIIQAPDALNNGDKLTVDMPGKKVISHFLKPKIDGKDEKVRNVIGELKIRENIMYFKNKPVLCNGKFIKTSKIINGDVS